MSAEPRLVLCRRPRRRLLVWGLFLMACAMSADVSWHLSAWRAEARTEAAFMAAVGPIIRAQAREIQRLRGEAEKAKARSRI